MAFGTFVGTGDQARARRGSSVVTSTGPGSNERHRLLGYREHDLIEARV